MNLGIWEAQMISGPSHPSGREQKQDCARERSRSGKGVDIGVLQGLGRKLGIATSCAWQALTIEFLTLGLLQFVYPEGIAVPL